MFYRKTIKELKEQIDLLKRENYNLLRDKKFLEEEVNISHKLSYMSHDIEDLKREFNSLKENILGRMIK